MPANPPLLLTDREAAEALRVTTRTMLNLRNAAGLPFVRIGSRIMYRPADLAAWIAARTVTETPTK